MSTDRSDQALGRLLREWRRRRRMSQLDLACDAEISTKHLSFLETGRAKPSRQMVLHLAGCLDVPLRDRNVLLSAAGFAPMFHARSFDEPALDMVRRNVEMVLAAHDPNPALAVDRHWTMLAANRAVAHLVAGAEPTLLRPPVNVLRLSMHPAGLASRIVNLPQWRATCDFAAAPADRCQRRCGADGSAGRDARLPEPARHGCGEGGGRERDDRGSVPVGDNRWGVCRFSAPRPCSERRWTSPSRNWRSRRFCRPMPKPPR